MLPSEVGQVAGLSTGEGMDRLVDVTDDTDIGLVGHPQLQQGALDRADVLVLVDGEVTVLVAHLGGHLRVLV